MTRFEQYKTKTNEKHTKSISMMKKVTWRKKNIENKQQC